MHEIFGDESARVLRFETNEEVLSTLQTYCQHKEIFGGALSAIGAAHSVTLSWYDMDEKRYVDKTFDGKWEITGLLGNVAILKKEIVVHAHGTFSDEHMQVVGGHVKRLIVGPTCELFLQIIPGTLKRAYDESTGLNLLQ